MAALLARRGGQPPSFGHTLAHAALVAALVGAALQNILPRDADTASPYKVLFVGRTDANRPWPSSPPT